MGFKVKAGWELKPFASAGVGGGLKFNAEGIWELKCLLLEGQRTRGQGAQEKEVLGLVVGF